MQCTITDLRDKEVINICSGVRLGYVGDVELITETGQITALIVPTSVKFCGLLGGEDPCVIPWSCIRKIGDDIILVEVTGQGRSENRNKKRFFG